MSCSALSTSLLQLTAINSVMLDFLLLPITVWWWWWTSLGGEHHTVQQETGAVSERSLALNSPLTTSVSACALSLSHC